MKKLLARLEANATKDNVQPKLDIPSNVCRSLVQQLEVNEKRVKKKPRPVVNLNDKTQIPNSSSLAAIGRLAAKRAIYDLKLAKHERILPKKAKQAKTESSSMKSFPTSKPFEPLLHRLHQMELDEVIFVVAMILHCLIHKNVLSPHPNTGSSDEFQ